VIFVSAGHHQEAQGASHQGFAEWPEAQIWASLLLYEICQHGGEAMAVPSGSLATKTTFINSWAGQSDIAVEIHFNGAADEQGRRVGRGSETLYYPGSKRGRIVAQGVQEAISGLFPPDRGIKEGWYRLSPENGPDWFLARTRPAAVIIEPDFIHRKGTIQRQRAVAVRAVADTLVRLDRPEVVDSWQEA
jgi:N-acetylmuramoyl-L-alanine amidase